MALDCLDVLPILTRILVLLSWFWDKFLSCVLIEVAVVLADISILERTSGNGDAFNCLWQKGLQRIPSQSAIAILWTILRDLQEVD